MTGHRRSALVTGAARRVGAHLARRLAARGYVLHLHAHTGDLESTAADLRREFDVPVSVHRLDLRDTDAVRKWAQAVRRGEDPPTLVVNNASRFPGPHAITDIGPLTEGMLVHLVTATVLLEALPDAGGHAVNMLDARLPLLDGERPGYELSKQALAHQTLLAAKRLAPKVRVNAISPGLLLPSPGCGEDGLARLALRRSPQHRTARLDDVAAALLFLENATSVTGQVIHVDAGEHLGAVENT
ncbi:NAD(P)-dependent dehydrogenase (short-subunit alcohol dehydrogenase family) [Spinactinospora alkalitolerans]|uniref:NAD(P)-dependent dehydrogenase (Short-subunit alcohol dehydrogenase family) n=1 Tax=Spinactinospora alkalitolerans TaxID=687207 RepID=A0A852U9D3_9ACTN|nr:SDR family oxidoreductase [Spinactinospora alkalitolerans]NYE50724.1 NAD(P)-dependent dehydrogenase (short-subunit alcohol dehydrogenase family) [Spinactinospora alkalitolerans]